MPTGLNIRDFTKVYREVRYANEGAFRLTEIEHNAYLNRLTLEVTHYDAYRSINYKSNPETTHWGYLTSFKGSSVAGSQAIKFVKQRVYENINQGIWNHHQASETTQLNQRFSEQGSNAVIQSGILTDASNKFVEFVLSGAEVIGESVNSAFDWLLGYDYGGNNSQNPPAESYTALPVSSPFPDVFKFKADVPVSFLFRLESWYLVNPAVYILSNPSDTSDETEGEDEYPSPLAGPGSGGTAPFPSPSPLDPANDPRDSGLDENGEVPGSIVTWNWTTQGFADRGDSLPPAVVGDQGTFLYELNGAPFTANAGDVKTRDKNGTSFYLGIDVFDRFGQKVTSVSTGAGYAKGTITITATIAV